MASFPQVLALTTVVPEVVKGMHRTELVSNSHAALLYYSEVVLDVIPLLWW